MNTPLLRLIPLGGVGDVTKNLYVYEYFPRSDSHERDIIIVDCGIGFPDIDMYGVDLVIPDVTYLKDKKQFIRAILLTHGHEDHIGALPYILPELGNIKLYASKLTAALAESKLEEFGLSRRIEHIEANSTLHIGPFRVRPVHVTHSIPDAMNFLIQTPIGTLYHGSDYKFDWTPVDGRMTEVGKIARAGDDGILCLLSDCVRSEKTGYTLSEQAIEETFEREIQRSPGKFIVTTQSSNISRLQQAINVALRHGRKIAVFGRSLDKSIDVTKRLKLLQIPDHALISDREVSRHPDKAICLLVAGSQGQIDSALSRIAREDHKFVKIKEGDTVVFSSDPIPGNENAVYTLIDELTRLGARTVYSDILEDLHVSGHGSEHDLRLMIGLAKPKYIVPIGGTYRHMRHYARLAEGMGYKEQEIFLLENGQILVFDPQKTAKVSSEHVEVKNIMVDGLGIGDVGNVVLRDRQQMAADGIVVIIVQVANDTSELVGEPDVISRGFVYMRESEKLIAEAKNLVRSVMRKQKGRVFDWQYIKKQIEVSLEKFLYEKTHRRPMIMVVVVEV